MAEKEMRIIILSQIGCVILGISSCLEPYSKTKLFASSITARVINSSIFQIDRTKPPFTFPKFDEFGNLSFAEEKKRLDYFAQELKSVPTEPGYIIEYRSKRARQKPLNRAKRAKNYLVKAKGIEEKRLFIVDGGYLKEFKLELRLGPTPAN